MPKRILASSLLLLASLACSHRAPQASNPWVGQGLQLEPAQHEPVWVYRDPQAAVSWDEIQVLPWTSAVDPGTVTPEQAKDLTFLAGYATNVLQNPKAGAAGKYVGEGRILGLRRPSAGGKAGAVAVTTAAQVATSLPIAGGPQDSVDWAFKVVDRATGRLVLAIQGTGSAPVLRNALDHEVGAVPRVVGTKHS